MLLLPPPELTMAKLLLRGHRGAVAAEAEAAVAVTGQAAVKSMKITEKTTLEKIMDKNGAEEILAKHGVPCVLCPMAKFELSKLKIGEVCKMYSLPIKEILKDLNK